MPNTFRTASLKFMEAVRTRDKATFESFLSKDQLLLAILPMGIFTDVDAYVASQKHWFEGTTGSFEYEVVNQLESPTLGVLTVHADYKNVDDDNKPFHLELLIAFTFRFVDGRWIKVQSQNSVIRKT